MCPQDKRAVLCTTGEEVAPRPACELAVGVEIHDAIWLAALDRVMHQIAGDRCALSVGLDANADMARRVPRRRLEPDLVGQPVIGGYKLGPACIDDRSHRSPRMSSGSPLPYSDGERVFASCDQCSHSLRANR